MKILHITKDFFPNRGWSETIIWPLIQIDLTHKNLVYVLNISDKNEIQIIRNVNVVRSKDVAKTNDLQLLVSSINPSLIIFHFIPNESSWIDVIHTYRSKFLLHHFNSICQRGDFIYLGKKQCNFKNSVKQCSVCYANSLGISRIQSELLYYLSGSIPHMLFDGKLRTALSIKSNIHDRLDFIEEFLNSVSEIILLNNWTFNEVKKFGIPSDRIISLPLPLMNKIITTKRKTISNKFNLVFVGRVAKSKGIEIIINAVIDCQNLGIPITLDLYGPIEDEIFFNQQILKSSLGSITYKGVIPDELVSETMSNYHYVVVPSQTSEIGPLVVLEAFASGTRVIGSNVNGIRELVETPELGFLVEFNNTYEWSKALQKAFNSQDYNLTYDFGQRTIENVHQHLTFEL